MTQNNIIKIGESWVDEPLADRGMALMFGLEATGNPRVTEIEQQIQDRRPKHTVA